MLKNERGMSRTEVMLVLAIIFAPATYFYVSELLSVQKEKTTFVELEKKFIQNSVNKLITIKKTEILSKPTPSYVKCVEPKSTTYVEKKNIKTCELDLNTLKTENLISPKWNGKLSGYPNIAWASSITIEPKNENITSNVYPAQPPNYILAAMKTLNKRLLDVLNK